MNCMGIYEDNATNNSDNGGCNKEDEWKKEGTTDMDIFQELYSLLI